MSSQPVLPPHYETLTHCPFCGAADIRPHLTFTYHPDGQKRFPQDVASHDLTQFYIARCQQCGLEFQSPRPTEAYLLHVIDATYPLRRMNTLRDELLRKDWELLRPYLKDGDRVLDVGCNTGEFLHLEQGRYAVSGCDPVSRAVALGREDYGLDLTVGTLADMPTAAVDVITMLDVFEHLHDPRAVLAEAAARLKPGGILYIRTLRRESLNARLSGRDWYAYVIWHLVYPETRHLLALAEQAGFVLDKALVSRTEGRYLRQTLRFQTQRGLARSAPLTPRLRALRQRLENGLRVPSFYRDEVVVLLRRQPQANPDA